MANERLKTALAQADLTGEQFAERVRVDPKTVTRWLSGSRVPYLKHRLRITELLGIDQLELWPELSATDGTVAEAVPEMIPVVTADAAEEPDWRLLAQAARRQLELLDLTLAAVIEHNEDVQILRDAAARGCRVRVLVSDRDSIHLALAAQDAGDEASVTGRPSSTDALDQTLKRLAPLLDRHEIELRTFVGAGSYRIAIADDEALITLRVPGAPTGEYPVLQATRHPDGSGVYDTFTKHFEHTWRSSEPAHH